MRDQLPCWRLVVSKWFYTVSQKVDQFYFYDKFDKRKPKFIIFTVKLRKDLREKLELKLSPPLKSVAALPSLWKASGQLYCFAAQLIQFEKKTFNYGKCSRRMLFLYFSTQINFRHVFKMSTFGTYAYFESWIPLVNGCVNCALFNAVPNVFLHNWKE